jgi:hypothetical protein
VRPSRVKIRQGTQAPPGPATTMVNKRWRTNRLSVRGALASTSLARLMLARRAARQCLASRANLA